jgi:hypothetical protein
MPHVELFYEYEKRRAWDRGMRKDQIFPLIISILMFGAALFYIKSKNWKMVIYWTCACIMNLVLTFL